MMIHTESYNGRLDIKALKDHNEDVSINAINVLKAEDAIRNLFYLGAKKHICGGKILKKHLTHTCTVGKKENRTVYYNKTKLRMLTQNINIDFLNHTKPLSILNFIRILLSWHTSKLQ